MSMILAWLTGNFRLITRVIGGVVAVALLVFLIWFFHSDIQARNGWKTAKARIVVLDSVVYSQARQIARKDSVIADRDSANATLSRTIKQIEGYAKGYQAEKDALQAAEKNRIGQMTYLQQVGDLFKRLYQRGTLAMPVAGTPDLILTDSVVVGANLKTVSDLDIAEKTGKKLQESISAKDARNEQLRIERLAKNKVIAGAARSNQDRLTRKSKGIIRRWTNGPQIKFLKAQRDSLNKALGTGEPKLDKALDRAKMDAKMDLMNELNWQP